MEKYNLKYQVEETKELIEDLQKAPSRMYEVEQAKKSLDNCECVECPCCDPEMKWLWAVGVPTLAASTGVMLLAMPRDIIGE